MRMLREALKDMPDDLEVRVSSSTEKGLEELTVEGAYREKRTLPLGRKFADGTTEIEYFTIYANDCRDR